MKIDFGGEWVLQIMEALDRLEELRDFLQENNEKHPEYDEHLHEYFELQEFLYQIM